MMISQIQEGSWLGPFELNEIDSAVCQGDEPDAATVKDGEEELGKSKKRLAQEDLRNPKLAKGTKMSGLSPDSQERLKQVRKLRAIENSDRWRGLPRVCQEKLAPRQPRPWMPRPWGIQMLMPKLKQPLQLMKLMMPLLEVMSNHVQKP